MKLKVAISPEIRKAFCDKPFPLKVPVFKHFDHNCLIGEAIIYNDFTTDIEITNQEEYEKIRDRIIPSLIDSERVFKSEEFDRYKMFRCAIAGKILSEENGIVAKFTIESASIIFTERGL